MLSEKVKTWLNQNTGGGDCYIALIQITLAKTHILQQDLNLDGNNPIPDHDNCDSILIVLSQVFSSQLTVILRWPSDTWETTEIWVQKYKETIQDTEINQRQVKDREQTKE